MDDSKHVDRLTKSAIRLLKIPRCLWDDAEQEAWVAYLSGQNIRTALRRFIDHERKHYYRRKKIEGFAEQHPGSIEQAEKDLE